MPLTKGLLDVLLSYPCPHCGHKQEKKGSWFQTVGHYACWSCGQIVRMRYDDKLRLFEANAHRAADRPEHGGGDGGGGGSGM
jgi:DNA-directed RNA polymerase subunit RPC12/RpoP